MAARYPGVNEAIRRALPDPLPRGTQTEMANVLGVSQPTVQRWFAGESSPEPVLWSAIEAHMGIEAGTLRAASLRREGATAAQHQARLGDLEVGQDLLLAHVVAIGAHCGIDTADFVRRQKALEAELRRRQAFGGSASH
jgi:DNA-binding transcriptional regulator YdaS (Cro superfamily)